MDSLQLIKEGIQYDEGVTRFSGYANIYEKYLCKYIDDPEFQKLIDAMDRKDYSGAFACAHTIKGMVGNLSLDGLLAKVKVLVELLRNGNDIDGAIAYLPEVTSEHQKVIEVLKEYFKK